MHVRRWVAALVLLSLTVGTPTEGRPCGIDLGRYVPAGPVVAVKGVSDNLSGITWSAKHQQLFAVINSPTRLLALKPDGTVARTVTLTGFHDTEAVSYIGGDRFWVLEEQRGRIIRIEVTADTTSITLDPKKHCIWVLDHIGHNDGLEALAVGRTGREVFAFKEKRVRRVYHADLPACASTNVPKTREVVYDIPWNAEGARWSSMKDLAGAHYDRRTGNLLVVSDDSARLVECTRRGKILSTFDLKGLCDQAEGVTMDERGVITVCGEPNQLLRLVPRR